MGICRLLLLSAILGGVGLSIPQAQACVGGQIDVELKGFGFYFDRMSVGSRGVSFTDKAQEGAAPKWCHLNYDEKTRGVNYEYAVAEDRNEKVAFPVGKVIRDNDEIPLKTIIRYESSKEVAPTVYTSGGHGWTSIENRLVIQNLETPDVQVVVTTGETVPRPGSAGGEFPLGQGQNFTRVALVKGGKVLKEYEAVYLKGARGGGGGRGAGSFDFASVKEEGKIKVDCGGIQPAAPINNPASGSGTISH